MTTTEKTEKAFKKLQRSFDRIKARTDRDIVSAVAKFMKTCKNVKGYALLSPSFSFKHPRLVQLLKEQRQ